MQSILYIGNKLEKCGRTPTAVDIIPDLLKAEGFQILSISTFQNKFLRLLEMCLYCLFGNYQKVLIDTYSTQNFIYARLCGSLFGNSKVNIAPSMFLKDAFEKHGFQNTKVIPNAIKTSNYPFKRRETFQPKLLWVRRFQERYNPIMAIEVLKIISEKYPQASLCMVGPEKDGTMKTCKKLAEKYELDVRFTGKLKKKYWSSLSQHYDFFINTTTVDNTPISVIEAMSLGLVVVSTNVGGMPQLIDHSTDGILIQDRSALQMAAAIQDIVEKPEVGVLLCKNAKSKVDEFDWSCVRDDWNQVLA